MLTAKQMKFVEEISEGGSQSNAYRKAYDASKMASKTVWEESSRLRKHLKVAARIIKLEAEKDARRRMQALSREDRVLQELEKIAFGDGPVTGKLKAIELLGKHIELFTPKEVPEVEMCEEEIRTEIQRRLEVFLD